MKKNRRAFVFLLGMVCCELMASTQTVSLNGQSWQVEGVSPDRSNTISLLGSVPGMVHPELQREGYIPDPFWKRDSVFEQSVGCASRCCFTCWLSNYLSEGG